MRSSISVFCVGQSIVLVQLAVVAVEAAAHPCRAEQFTQDSFVLVSSQPVQF